MPVKNKKFLLSIGVGVLCALVVTAGLFFFWQQDRSYHIRMDNLNKAASPGYETIDTHQFGPLLEKYKSRYMGDAANINNLFNNLLLVRAGVGIEMDPDTYTLKVYYQTSEEELQSANVRVALPYNSVAAFTLIDNLQNIEYYFPGNNFVYLISRASVEEWFDQKNLSAYFPDQATWESKFQEFMKDSEYRERFFLQSFVTAYFDGDPNRNGATATVGVTSTDGDEGTKSST